MKRNILQQKNYSAGARNYQLILPLNYEVIIPEQMRNQIEMLSIEDVVPKNHILRDIDRALNFDFIYDLVEDLYCADNGRPSIDPVVLFKIILIKFLFGIRSIRQTIKEIEVNMAYRWFLGYGMTEKIPHFSTEEKRRHHTGGQ